MKVKNFEALLKCGFVYNENMSWWELVGDKHNYLQEQDYISVVGKDNLLSFNPNLVTPEDAIDLVYKMTKAGCFDEPIKVDSNKQNVIDKLKALKKEIIEFKNESATNVSDYTIGVIDAGNCFIANLNKIIESFDEPVKTLSELGWEEIKKGVFRKNHPNLKGCFKEIVIEKDRYIAYEYCLQNEPIHITNELHKAIMLEMEEQNESK